MIDMGSEPQLPPPLFYRMDTHTRYLDPLTDFGFKKLFGEEVNKDILIAFLNDVLPDDKEIETLKYLKNEQLGKSSYERRGVFDLYCISEKGEHFIVELQRAHQRLFSDRSIFYSSYVIQNQAEKGDWNFELSAVYTIGILNFPLNEMADNSDYYHLIELKDQHNEVFSDKLKYIYLELTKFTKTVDELVTPFEKWIFIFRHLATLEDRPAGLQERIFTKLFAAAEVAQFTREERDLYEADLKVRRDLKNQYDSAVETGWEEGWEMGMEKGIEEGIEKGIEQGIEKGIEKGIEQGIEKGIEQGIEKGMEQGIEKGMEKGRQEGRQKGKQEGRQEGRQEGKREGIRIAVEGLLKAGTPIAKIAEIMGLTESEIDQLSSGMDRESE